MVSDSGCVHERKREREKSCMREGTRHIKFNNTKEVKERK